jgi:hypothetical protein
MMPSAEIETQDAEAQATARNAQVALEVYATDHNGNYAGADAQALEAIEPALRDPPGEGDCPPDGRWG